MGVLQERIEKALVLRGVSQRKLAEKIGIKQQSVNSFMSKNATRWKHLHAVATALNVSFEWLSDGIGPMTDEESLTGMSIPSGAAHEDVSRIAELDLRAVAGLGGSALEVTSEHEAEAVVGFHSYPARSYGAMFGADPQYIRICEIIGDSMVPTFFPGQRVAVDIRDKVPSPPGVFFVWDGIGIVCKRVDFVPYSDPQRIVIISDNAKYRERELLLEDAQIQGRVIGLWQRT